jgi:hypothetical protein
MSMCVHSNHVIPTVSGALNTWLQAIIDLLIPGQSPGIKEPLVDLYGKPELLFFGPDGKRAILELVDGVPAYVALIRGHS